MLKNENIILCSAINKTLISALELSMKFYEHTIIFCATNEYHTDETKRGEKHFCLQMIFISAIIVIQRLSRDI